MISSGGAITPIGAVEKGKRRRRLAATIAPVGLVLGLGGGLLAGLGGMLRVLGFMVLMQGVGLLVAALPLAFGHNPLDRD